MKRIAIILTSFIALHSQAQRTIQKLWETDTTLATPESVLPDTKNGVLYVSLIDGQAWAADGKGGIAKVDLNGKITNADWITGLHAPKGMGMFGDKLYVADLTDVVVIDTKKGAVESRIPVEGAQQLNDITVDSKGVIYASDSRAGTVYRIENGKSSSYLTGYNGLNGLRAVGNDLYLGTRELVKIDAAKQKSTLGMIDQGADGIEPVGNGDWIGSAWAGYIYYLHADGKRDVLLDTHEQRINAADIGFDPAKKIIYVPTFSKKSVVAYQLK